MKKWVFDKVNNRIVTEDDKENILYTDSFMCGNYIFKHIVYLHNIGMDSEIDNFLLNAPCTQDERENIVETLVKLN